MNMSQAVQLTKGLAKQHRAVLAVAEVMEEIVNLEDMRDAVLKQSNEVANASNEATAQLNKISLALKKAKGELKNIEDIHEEMVGEANKKANSIVAEASNEAKEIVGEAQKEADKVRKEAGDFNRGHADTMIELSKEIEEKETHLNKIKESLAHLRERIG